MGSSGRRLFHPAGFYKVPSLKGVWYRGPFTDDGLIATLEDWFDPARWSLTAERVVKSPEALDLSALLDRIESEMGNAAPEVQWTMNCCLAEIGIHFPDHRERALAIGEALGIYRDYPASKGCTSPFAPIWINEMVSRQG